MYSNTITISVKGTKMSTTSRLLTLFIAVDVIFPIWTNIPHYTHLISTQMSPQIFFHAKKICEFVPEFKKYLHQKTQSKIETCLLRDSVDIF